MIKSYIEYIKELSSEEILLQKFKGFPMKKEEDKEYRNKATNQLIEKFVPTYSDFEETELYSYKGYKVVEKINLNYYSIVSGIFRYKRGKIEYKSYSSLYRKNTKYFNDHLLDKLAIFTNKEDAIESLIETKSMIKKWSSNHNDLALMEMVISGDIEKAKFSNISVNNKDVFIGDTIESIRELEII
jgi:hypothetical protein